MPKKYLTFFSAILSIMILFSACSGKSMPGNNGKDNSSLPSVQTQPSGPIDPTRDPEPTDPGQPELPEDPEKPDEVPDAPEPTPYISAAQAKYGASADGYAIWTGTRGFSTAKRLCIDSDGFIVFEMDKSETDVAGVHNHAVMMKVNYDYYVLRAVPSGELLFDSSAADGASIILPDHNGKAMFRDGYIMVMKADAESNSFELGFLDAKGQWLQPLSADNPVLRHFDQKMTIDSMEKEVTYLGEGIIGMLCSDQVYRYYNIVTNEITSVSFPNNISKYTMYDALDYNVRFVDGVSDPVYMNNNYYLFYSDGRIVQFNVLWPYGIPRAIMLGKPYFDRVSNVAYFLYEYEDCILVADNTGKVIKKHQGIKLKEYNYFSADRTACRSFTSDGLARLIIENTDGSCSYAILNIMGEFLFEPIPLNENINRVFDLEGYNIEVNATNGAGCYVVIDNAGNVCYESDYVNDFSVRNGVLHYKEENEDIYVIIHVPALY